MKLVAVILLHTPADGPETFPPSPSHFINERVVCEPRWADRLLPSSFLKETMSLWYKNKHPVLSHCDWWGPKIPPDLEFIPTLNPPLFSSSRRHWKKPNVCLLSPVLSSSLPPLSPTAPPALVAWTALHAAVQRQPQRPKPHQLPQLLPRGVLPAADRTDKRDGQPGGQWPVAVRREGPGVLHSGPEGKDAFIMSRTVQDTFSLLQIHADLQQLLCFRTLAYFGASGVDNR